MHLWGGIYAIEDSITNSSRFIMPVRSEIKLVILSHLCEVLQMLFKLKFGNWEAVSELLSFCKKTQLFL